MKRSLSTPAKSPAAGNGNNKGTIAMLDRLHKQQVTWTDTVFKAANDGLITLLGECVDAYAALRKDADERKAVAAALKGLDLEANDGTHLATRVVRYVFRAKTTRVARYAAIVRSAIEHKIDGMAFAKWVKEQGGLDAIRRKTKVADGTVLTPRQLSDQAKNVLAKAPALHVVPKAPAALKASGKALDTFALALVRYNTQTGGAEIVHGSDNAGLTRRYFEVVGKAVLANSAKAVQSASASAQRKKSHAAIQSVVAAATAIAPKKSTAKAA